jgi:hypothetical protein
LKFSYEYQNKKVYWIPDFKLSDGTYVEIKGFLSEKDKAKFEFFSEKLLLLTEEKMQDIFNYVCDTYGKNFICLYETKEE